MNYTTLYTALSTIMTTLGYTEWPIPDFEEAPAGISDAGYSIDPDISDLASLDAEMLNRKLNTWTITFSKAYEASTKAAVIQAAELENDGIRTSIHAIDATTIGNCVIKSGNLKYNFAFPGLMIRELKVLINVYD